MITKIKQLLIDRYQQPTKQSSRREYSKGNIAEFWCTLSNFGFFFVGLLFGDLSLLLAGIFSLLSHTVPSQLVHDLDILGVVLIGIKILLSLPFLISNPVMLPFVLGFGGLAIAINILDAFITPRYYDKVGPWLHVAWHLSAAVAMFSVNLALFTNPLFLLTGTGIAMLVGTALLSLAATAASAKLAAIWNKNYQKLYGNNAQEKQNDLEAQAPSSQQQTTESPPSSFNLLNALMGNRRSISADAATNYTSEHPSKRMRCC